MEACAGGFADGVEVWHIGGGGEVGLDAPDLVVGGGVDGDGIGRGVDAEGFEGGPDAREAGFEMCNVAAIEPDMLAALSCELLGDCSGDDIAWGELCELVDRGHEAVARIVKEVSAFATDGFGDERARGARDVQSCWVELDELHVLE